MLKSQKVIIVGGGSAGWMTAATLIKLFPKKNITVIESPTKGTISVGESTLSSINQWLDLLEIKDKDFMPYTKASYKLSIRFENFYKLNDGGFHYPFGSVYENNFVGSKETWFLKKEFNSKIPNSNYANFVSPTMSLVNNNVLFKNENKEIPLFNFKNDVAYHFDAVKFADWLKKYYCIPKGVKHIYEDINTIEKDKDGIKSLNKKHKADLYIDCTGFSSLLLGQALKEPFEDYSDLLPNNKAWATNLKYTNKEKQLKPYTNCTAIQNGWVWNIPSWDKIGTGYVYSDKFISDDEALNQFKKYLKQKNLVYKNIKMRVGTHKRLFVKNVCAIGLSGAFIEPLESNGLLTVHEFLIKLVKILKRKNLSQWDRDNFNYYCKDFFNFFAEFVAYHYALSHRRDTKYWKEINNKSFYDKRRIDTELKSNMEVYMNNYQFNSFPGVHYISAGMNYFNINTTGKSMPNNIKDYIFNREIEIKKFNKICKQKNTLFNYLKYNIHNK